MKTQSFLFTSGLFLHSSTSSAACALLKYILYDCVRSLMFVHVVRSAFSSLPLLLVRILGL